MYMDSFTWVGERGGKAEISKLASILLTAGEPALFPDRWGACGPVVHSKNSTPPADDTVSLLEKSWSFPPA